jgi:hypothetical protein
LPRSSKALVRPPKVSMTPPDVVNRPSRCMTGLCFFARGRGRGGGVCVVGCL